MKYSVKRTLYLNENPLPAVFTRGTISGKELRLRSALEDIDEIHVLSRRGQSVQLEDNRVGKLEKKIFIHLLPPCPYYLSSLPLFVYGIWAIRKYNPVLIEAESPILSGPAAVLLGKLFKIPVIIEVRASYDELIKYKLKILPVWLKRVGMNFVKQFSLRHADGVIVNSKHYQSQLKKQGIDSSVIHPGLQYAPKLMPMKKNKNEVVVGYIGRIVYEKGVDLLVLAIYELLKMREGLNIKVLIAGDGPERVTLEELVTTYGLEEIISFVGWQHNYSFLKLIDILVNPNRVYHPLEMVNVEAAYMGVPVVCFGDSTVPETVVDGLTGVVVKKHDSQSLAIALKQVLEVVHDNSNTYAHSSDWATTLYSMESQCQSIHKLYKRLRII